MAIPCWSLIHGKIKDKTGPNHRFALYSLAHSPSFNPSIIRSRTIRRLTIKDAFSPPTAIYLAQQNGADSVDIASLEMTVSVTVCVTHSTLVKTLGHCQELSKPLILVEHMWLRTSKGGSPPMTFSSLLTLRARLSNSRRHELRPRGGGRIILLFLGRGRRSMFAHLVRCTRTHPSLIRQFIIRALPLPLPASTLNSSVEISRPKALSRGF